MSGRGSGEERVWECKIFGGSGGVCRVKMPFGAPNANYHSEKYVLICKKECLNHLLIFGLNRLQHVVDCYTLYFNEHRPHQGIDNNIPAEYNVSTEW